MLDVSSYQLSSAARLNVRVRITKAHLTKLLQAPFWRVAEHANFAKPCCKPAEHCAIDALTPYLLSRKLLEASPPISLASLAFGDPNPVVQDALSTAFRLRDVSTPTNINQIRSLHSIVVGESSESSRLRSNDIYVQNSNRFSYPLAGQLPGMVNYALNHGLKKKTVVRILATAAALCLIHPFEDGNGRTSRAFALLHIRTSDYNLADRLLLFLTLGAARKRFWRALEQWICFGSEGAITSVLGKSKTMADALALSIQRDLQVQNGPNGQSGNKNGKFDLWADNISSAPDVRPSDWEMGPNSADHIRWNREAMLVMNRYVANFLSFA